MQLQDNNIHCDVRDRKIAAKINSTCWWSPERKNYPRQISARQIWQQNLLIGLFMVNQTRVRFAIFFAYTRISGWRIPPKTNFCICLFALFLFTIPDSQQKTRKRSLRKTIVLFFSISIDSCKLSPHLLTLFSPQDFAFIYLFQQHQQDGNDMIRFNKRMG